MVDQDWTEHAGGPCPAEIASLWIAVRTRAGDEINPRQGRFWRWEHRNTAGDIMFYRIADGPVWSATVDGEVA